MYNCTMCAKVKITGLLVNNIKYRHSKNCEDLPILLLKETF